MDNSNADPYGSSFSTEIDYILLLLLIFGTGTIMFAIIKAAGHALKRFRSYYDESDEQLETRLVTLALKISDNYRLYSYSEHIASTVIYSLMVFLFTLLLLHFGLLTNSSITIQIMLIVMIVLFGAVSYIIGVVLPRNIASKYIISTAKFTAPIMQFFYYMFFPFVIMVKRLDSRIKNKAQKSGADNSQMNDGTEEIRYLIEESSKSGILNLEDQELMENVIDFTETTVKQVMVPRNRIVALEKNADTSTIKNKILDEGYSRMPIYEGSLDNIIGIINTRDILISMLNDEFDGLEKFIRETIFVKEGENIDSLLKAMQSGKIQITVVLDDFGGTAGIVTMEDILEELVGEIQDEHDEEHSLVEINNDGSYTVRASANIVELNEQLPSPLPESEDYETLGGLIMTETETIPETGESYDLFGYKMIILNRTSRHIDTVQLIRLEHKI